MSIFRLLVGVMLRTGACIPTYAERGQRMLADVLADIGHGVVRGAYASHRGVLRTGLVFGVGASRMQSDANVMGHLEADNAVRAVRPVGVGRVWVRCLPVDDQLGSVGDMWLQAGMTVDVVVSRPAANDVAVIVVQ